MTELSELRADCSRCVALCCVVPAFQRSSEFAIDKPAGVPCLHLADDHRCSIHDRLTSSGFPGCVAFDCFGAGQRLSQQLPAATAGPAGAGIDADVAAAFPVLLGLHELLWHLGCATRWEGPADLRTRLGTAAAQVEETASSQIDRLRQVDLDALRADVGRLLGEASAAVRSGLDGPDRSGADLAGADLRRQDLSGASFRGALLLGADLREADLSCADLLGADLRGADLRGARLATALFLTRTQVGSARGDRTTTLPDPLEHPAHWR